MNGHVEAYYSRILLQNCGFVGDIEKSSGKPIIYIDEHRIDCSGKGVRKTAVLITRDVSRVEGCDSKATA